MLQNYVKKLTASCLLATLVCLAGCATLMPVSTPSCPALPPMPSVAQPEPTEDYSLTVERLLKEWDERLQVIEAMLKN